jgi:hypothetical protein
MFSEEVFISDCVSFLQTNRYEDYEDIIPDIKLFIKVNLPSELNSLVKSLFVKILASYIKYENEELVYDTDNNLY